jgi:hypothetical protein
MSAPKTPILGRPREVFNMLFVSSSRDDLKNLSIACKYCRISAYRALFHTVYLGLNLTSFANLILISRNIVLGGYVRRIMYIGWEDYGCISFDAQSIVTYSNWLDKYPGRNYDVIFEQEMEDIKSFDASRVALLHSTPPNQYQYPYGQEYLEYGNNAQNLLREPLASFPGLSRLCCANFSPFGFVDSSAWKFLATAFELNSLNSLKKLNFVFQDPQTRPQDYQYFRPALLF